MSNSKYQYLFGPVPSRRLGISLGVDLVPHKTCSLNCIYCECGKTTNLTMERKEYVPTKKVISELNQFLSTNPKLDYITFSGAGEPTLHSGIGSIVSFLKETFPFYKIALLTNGTLFHQQNLIDEVKSVDLLLPSLDAASNLSFRKINRPVKDLNIESIIEGLSELRAQFTGQIWLEIFIVSGLNDSEDEIDQLKKAIGRIKPDKIQLNTLDRPGTVDWIKPVSKEILEHIASKLDWQTEIIANFQTREQIASYNNNIEDTILQTVRRRPCTVEDLSSVLGLHQNEVNKYINAMLQSKKIKQLKMKRGLFLGINDQ